LSIDFTTGHGPRALDQLNDEHVIWMTTVGSLSATPQPNLVWFLYQDGDVIVYTKPDAARLTNIARNPRVSLHFNSPEDGEQMTIFTGTAVIDPAIKAVINNTEYLEKYERWLEYIKTTPQAMSEEYNVPIRISLDKLRGW
jgi:PPOX class probable F420-dependent enzyme